MGIAIVAGSALVGGVATLVLNSGPGTVLGVCVVIGTLAAGLAVRRRAAYLLLPAPALSYTVVALATGRIHDPSNTSHLDQLIHAGTWVANGFVSMVAATIVAIVVFGIQLFLDRRLNSSGPRRSGGGPRRPAPSPPPRPDFGQTGPMPRYGATEAGYGTGSQPGYGPSGASGAPGGYSTSSGSSPGTGTGTGGTGPAYGGNGTGPMYTGNGSEPGHGHSGANPAYGGTGPTFRPAPRDPYSSDGAQRPPLPNPYRPELPPGRQR